MKWNSAGAVHAEKMYMISLMSWNQNMMEDYSNQANNISAAEDADILPMQRNTCITWISGECFGMDLYWKTRNLFGMALIHGFNDFLPNITDDIFAFEGMDRTEGYISGDSAATVIYLIQLCFEPAVFIYVYRKAWKNTDRQKVPEEWQRLLREEF